MGVAIYKMMFGMTPFYDKNQSVLMKKIQNRNPVFPDKRKYKLAYSEEVVDLINGLLMKDKA